MYTLKTELKNLQRNTFVFWHFSVLCTFLRIINKLMRPQKWCGWAGTRNIHIFSYFALRRVFDTTMSRFRKWNLHAQFSLFSSKWAEKHNFLHAQPNFYMHRAKVTCAFVLLLHLLWCMQNPSKSSPAYHRWRKRRGNGGHVTPLKCSLRGIQGHPPPPNNNKKSSRKKKNVV